MLEGACVPYWSFARFRPQLAKNRPSTFLFGPSGYADRTVATDSTGELRMPTLSLRGLILLAIATILFLRLARRFRSNKSNSMGGPLLRAPSSGNSFCTNCGAALPGSGLFCGGCGARRG